MFSGGTAQVGTSSAEARHQAQLHGKWWLRVMKGVVQAHEVAEPAPRPYSSIEASEAPARSPQALLNSEAGFDGSAPQAVRDDEIARLQAALDRQRAAAEDKIKELQAALAEERSKHSEIAGTVLELEVARQETVDLKERLEVERTLSQRALDAAKAGMASEMSRAEAEVFSVFLVDNSVFGASTDGLGYRRSKNLDDRLGEAPENIAAWGTLVSGIDHNDGWVQVGGHFLPKMVHGKRVLAEDIYWLDVSSVKASTDGLAYRKSKQMEDRDRSAVARWGSYVTGVDEGDGWLRVGELYLPFKLGNHSVVVKHARAEPDAATVAKPREINVVDTAPAYAMALEAATMKPSEAERQDSLGSWAPEQALSPTARGKKSMEDMPKRIISATAGILHELDKMEIFSDSSGSPRKPSRSRTAPAFGRDSPLSPTARELPRRIQNDSAKPAELDTKAEVFSVFLVDNSVFGASTDGLGYRRSKNLDDRLGEAPENIAAWGTIVSGIDHNDGWVQVGGYFLPKIFQGKRVLAEDVYWLDVSSLKDSTDGLAYRKSKQLEDRDRSAVARWGSYVTGVDEGDGWLRVGELYLPFKLGNHSVVVKHARAEPDAATVAKPREINVGDTAPAYAMALEAATMNPSEAERQDSLGSWAPEQALSPTARGKKSMEDMPKRIISATAGILHELDKMEIFSDSSGSPRKPRRSRTVPALGRESPRAIPKAGSMRDSGMLVSSETAEARELPRRIQNDSAKPAELDTKARELAGKYAEELDAKARELAARDDELAAKRSILEDYLYQLKTRVSKMQPRSLAAENERQIQQDREQLELSEKKGSRLGETEAGFIREDSTFNAMVEEVSQLRAERETFQAAIQKHMDERGMTDQEMVSEVLIPEGLRPGDDFIAATPDGNQIPVRVPDDAYGGCMMEFTYKVHVPEGMTLLQGLEMLVEAHQERDMQYRAETESLEVALQDARQHYSSLASEHSALGEEHRTLHAKHTGLADEHRGLVDMHQQLTAKATVSSRDLSMVQESLAGTQDAKQQLTTERDGLIKQNALLQGQIQTLTADYESMLASQRESMAQESLAVTQEANQQLTMERDELITQVALLQGQIQTLTADYESLLESHRKSMAQENLAGTQEANQQLTMERNELITQNALLQGQMQTLNSDYESLMESHQKSMAQESTQVAVLQGQIQTLTADYESLIQSQRTSMAQESLAGTRDANQQLVMERDELITQNARLQGQIQTLTSGYLAGTQDANQQLVMEPDELLTQNALLQGQVQQLTADYEALMESHRKSMAQESLAGTQEANMQQIMERDELITQVALLQGQIQTLTGDYESLIDSHRNKAIEVEEWRMRASNLEQEVQELQDREPTVIHRENSLSGEKSGDYKAEIDQLQGERTVLIEELAKMNLKIQQMEADMEAQQARESHGVVSHEAVEVERLEDEFIKLQNTCEERINMLVDENSTLKEQLSTRQVLEAENQTLLAQAASANSIQNTLQAENDRLMAEIMATRTSQNTWQTAHDQLVDEVAAVRAAYQALQDERKTLVFEIESAGSRLDQSTDMHRALQAENDRLLTEVSSLNDAHQSLQVEKGKLMSDMSSTGPELQRLQAENERLIIEMSSVNDAHQSLQVEKSKLLSDMSSTEPELQRLQAENQRLMTELTSTTPELLRLQADNQKLMAEISMMSESAPELQRLQAENQQLLKEINSVVPEHADLRVERETLKNELASIVSQHKDLKDQYSRLQADTSALIPEFQQLQVENRELQNENAKIIPTLQEFQAEREKLKGEMQGSRAHVQELQVQNQQLEAQIAASGPELKTLQARIEQLLGEIATARPLNEQLQAENQRLQTHVIEVGKTNEALQEENQRMLSELAGAGSAVMIPALDNTAGSAATVAPRGLSAPEAPVQRGPQANPQAIEMAEKWVSSYKAPPVQNTPSLIYLNRIPVVFDEFASTLAPVAAANAPYRSLVLQEIESGSLMRRALATYKTCDTECIGTLAWTTGAVRDFVAEVFEQKGLSAPSDAQIYELFLQFDQDSSWSLSVNECLCLADAAFRTVFIYPEAALEADAEAERAQLTRGITVEFPSETGPELITEQLQPQPIIQAREIVAEPLVVSPQPQSIMKAREIVAEPLVVSPRSVTRYAEVIKEPLQSQPMTRYAEVISETLTPPSVMTNYAEVIRPQPVVKQAETSPPASPVLERGSALSATGTPKLSTAPRVVKPQEVRKAESLATAAAAVRFPSLSGSGSSMPGRISGLGTPGGMATPPALPPPRVAQVLEPRRIQASSSINRGIGSIGGEAMRPVVVSSMSASSAPSASAHTYTVQGGMSAEVVSAGTVTRQASHPRAEVLSSRVEGLSSYAAPSLASRAVPPQIETVVPRRISSYSPPAEILTPTRAPAKDTGLSSASSAGMKRLDPARVSQRQ